MAMSLQMSEMSSEMKAIRNKDRIILNVGGIRHETFKSTLRNFPDTRLAWITERDNFTDYDPEKNEYFFDRHPGIFQQIINFYRTGKLHCPSDVCGPLFEEELNFWGIDEKQMEPCCWSTYTLHREAQENLKVFNGPDFDDLDSETEQEEWKSGETSDEHRSSNTPAWQRWRSRMWAIFNDSKSTSKVSKIYVWVSLVFVVVSVISLCASTDSNVKESFEGEMVIKVIDNVCGVWFTIEFLMRCATCPNIIEFSKQFLNWIDFLAIIPFYLNHAMGHGNIVSEILVLGRMLRLLRFFNKMSLGFQILKHTLVASSKEMFLLLLLVMIPVLIFAGILYLCEKPVINTKFKSIPEAFWWAIITLTTVGYGDMAPLTTQGKIFGSICAAVSMLISALPISIIGANFSLYYRHAQAKLKLPKKPRKILIGAANTLLQDERENEPETSERNSSDDLTTEVYLGPKRPRRERMSLFCNGAVTQRNNSRLRSLGSDNLPGQTDQFVDESNFSGNSPDYHKSSLLSTSTKSTTVDSPPPRCVSFPANLPGRDKNRIFEPGGKSGTENSGYRKDNEDVTARTSDGSSSRSLSAGSRYKRNGIIHPTSAPRVTITAEVANEKNFGEELTKNINNNEKKDNLNVPLNDYDERTNGPVNADNKPLTTVEG